MHGTTKSLVTAGIAAALLLAASAPLLAQQKSSPLPDGYPSKPIRMIVSAIPGAGSDILARIVSKALGEKIDRSLVVDNRGGANGVPAMNEIVRAAPDGHTIMTAGNLLILNGVLKKVPYDIRKTLEPVAQMSSQPYLLLVVPSLPISNLKELVQYAKSHPRGLSYASSGLGAVNHLAMELLTSRTGIELVHVPYKGNAQAYGDLLTERIHLIYGAGASSTPHIKSGKLRAIAISGGRRATAFPDLPTVAESGVSGYDVTNSYSLYVPAGVTGPIVAWLSREVNEIVNSVEVKGKLATEGADPGVPRDPAALKDAFIKEYATWENFLSTSKIKLTD